MGEKIERVREFQDVLSWLLTIGNLKNHLPLNLQGQVASLGLYVQLRQVGRIQRLQAGGKYKPYFDVINPDSSNLRAWLGEDMARHWKVKRFDKTTWDLRFAHLVEPTFDVVLFVSDHIGKFDEQAVAKLSGVVDHFRATGKWLGLPSGGTCADCGQDVTYGQWRREYCPRCGAKLKHS